MRVKAYLDIKWPLLSRAMSKPLILEKCQISNQHGNKFLKMKALQPMRKLYKNTNKFSKDNFRAKSQKESR